MQDTVDSALSKAPDAAEAEREADRSRAKLESVGELHPDAFVEHAFAMPEVGDDTDFERDPSPPRDIEL